MDKLTFKAFLISALDAPRLGDYGNINKKIYTITDRDEDSVF